MISGSTEQFYVFLIEHKTGFKHHDRTGTRCAVTGASEGLGALIALHLAQRGVTLSVVGSRDPKGPLHTGWPASEKSQVGRPFYDGYISCEKDPKKSS